MKGLEDKRAVLLDLDDTLYLSEPCENAAHEAILSAVATASGISAGDIRSAYDEARRTVKKRLSDRGSSHSRMLYLTEMTHELERPDLLEHVREWNELFWHTYVDYAKLRPRAMPFIDAVRAAGRKVAIVSDLTLAPQLYKLERFDLFGRLDAIAISEEALDDKPHHEIFRIALERLGVEPGDALMVGDDADKDGKGAHRLGIAFVQIPLSDVEGATFDEIASAMGIAA